MDPNQESAASQQQGMLPPMNQPQAPVPQAAPAGPPEASTSFDVKQNPQDMQLMTDAAMYAPMLQQMSPEQRAEKWPGIVDKLSQVSPKAATMLDPTLPPSDKDLEALTSRLPGNREGAAPAEGKKLVNNQDDFMAEQVKRQLRGEKPQSLIEYNAQKAKEEQMKKAYQDARDPNKMSNAEFAFEAAMLAGKGGKYMTASYAGDDEEKKAPMGYEYTTGDDGTQTLRPIKNGPADLEVIKAQAAARKQPTAPTEGQVALAKAAENLLPLIKELPFNKDYTLDRTALALPKYGVVNEKGTQYDNAVTKVAQAFLRLITGATAPQKETDDMKAMIQCKATDTPDICAQKYIFAEQFYKNLPTLQKDDPSTKSGKNVDMEKVRALQEKSQTAIILYKEKWKSNQAAAYPNVPMSKWDEMWTNSVLNSPEFVQKITDQMEKDKKESK